MGITTAAKRKATERINRQVVPWRYRAELEHAIGVAAGLALAHGDTISRAELIERTVNLLVQLSNDATRKLLMAHKVRSEDLSPVETMRDEAADCLHRHFVTVTEEEEARRKVFDAPGPGSPTRRHDRRSRRRDVSELTGVG
jgi:hypothetical protein